MRNWRERGSACCDTAAVGAPRSSSAFVVSAHPHAAAQMRAVRPSAAAAATGAPALSSAMTMSQDFRSAAAISGVRPSCKGTINVSRGEFFWLDHVVGGGGAGRGGAGRFRPRKGQKRDSDSALSHIAGRGGGDFGERRGRKETALEIRAAPPTPAQEYNTPIPPSATPCAFLSDPLCPLPPPLRGAPCWLCRDRPCTAAAAAPRPNSRRLSCASRASRPARAFPAEIRTYSHTHWHTVTPCPSQVLPVALTHSCLASLPP